MDYTSLHSTHIHNQTVACEPFPSQFALYVYSSTQSQARFPFSPQRLRPIAPLYSPTGPFASTNRPATPSDKPHLESIQTQMIYVLSPAPAHWASQKTNTKKRTSGSGSAVCTAFDCRTRQSRWSHSKNYNQRSLDSCTIEKRNSKTRFGLQTAKEGSKRLPASREGLE